MNIENFIFLNHKILSKQEKISLITLDNINKIPFLKKRHDKMWYDFFIEIIIKFNDVKCLINVKENDRNSIRDIKNFVAERINNNTYKFTYTFTEADYNRASTCP